MKLSLITGLLIFASSFAQAASLKQIRENSKRLIDRCDTTCYECSVIWKDGQQTGIKGMKLNDRPEEWILVLDVYNGYSKELRAEIDDVICNYVPSWAR